MAVLWSRQALADIGRIVCHIAAENPVAARRVAREVVLGGDSLALFPHRGRASRLPGRRELVAIHPYVIVYRVRPGNDVDILRVWHAAQDRV